MYYSASVVDGFHTLRKANGLLLHSEKTHSERFWNTAIGDEVPQLLAIQLNSYHEFLTGDSVESVLNQQD